MIVLFLVRIHKDPLCFVLMGLHLEYCVQFGPPNKRRTLTDWKQSSRGSSPKMVMVLQHTLREEGLQKLDLLILEKRRLREGIHSAYIY